MVAYHSGSDAKLSQLVDWPTLQDGGAVADGVLLFMGDKRLVIAPHEASCLFASTNELLGGTVASRNTALDDWNGKSNTSEQSSSSYASSTDYASYYCNAYSNGGIAAGSWFLPSAGELMSLYVNRKRINYALSLINGATQLSEGLYWSSTEYTSKYYAWAIDFSCGKLMSDPKSTRKYLVRPVASY